MEKKKSVNMKALEADMDRLVDWFNKAGKPMKQITLTQDQYEAFLKKHDGHPYYRSIPVVVR